MNLQVTSPDRLFFRMNLTRSFDSSRIQKSFRTSSLTGHWERSSYGKLGNETRINTVADPISRCNNVLYIISRLVQYVSGSVLTVIYPNTGRLLQNHSVLHHRHQSIGKRDPMDGLSIWRKLWMFLMYTTVFIPSIHFPPCCMARRPPGKAWNKNRTLHCHNVMCFDLGI